MRQIAAVALLTATLAVAALAGRASAQEQAPLLRAVPGDVHFFVHGVAPKDPDPATLAAERFMKSLCDSGAHKDLFELMTLQVPDAQRAHMSAAMDEAFRLLGLVDWALLVERESAFAFRLGVPVPEYLVVFRVPRDAAAAQVSALKETISGLVRMTGQQPSVTEAERTSGKMTLVSIPGFPVQIAMGAVGDALVLATSANLGASAMSRLASGSDEGSILASEAAKTATNGLPQTRDGVEYVDMDAMLGFVGQMMGMAGTMMPNDGSQNPEVAREIIGLALAVLQDVNVVDSIATSHASESKRTSSTTRVTFRPEAGQSRLAKLTSSQRPWTDWAKRVPKDATSFAFTPGADLTALYDWALALVKENLSAQDEILAKWDEMQKGVGIRLRDDVLACFSGESATISFPALPGGCATGEGVTYMRLEQPDRVASQLKSILEAAAGYVASRGHKVELVSRGALTEIRIATLPWLHPAIGVIGDELVVASSGAAAEKLERVAKGAEPNILSEPRFAELGVGKREGLTSVGFSSVDTSPEPFASIISTIGFVYSLLPDDRQTRPIVLMGRLMCKFGVALREFDVQFDQAYETAHLPNGAVETRVVTRFK